MKTIALVVQSAASGEVASARRAPGPDMVQSRTHLAEGRFVPAEHPGVSSPGGLDTLMHRDGPERGPALSTMEQAVG